MRSLYSVYTLTQVINILRHLGVKNFPPRMLTQLRLGTTSE